MAKERKLDLFKLLSKLSAKDWEYYEALDDEAKKEVSPYLVMRWLSCTNDARQVFFLNAIVNPFVFAKDFTNHKSLLIKLMTICTSGRDYRYTWIASKKKTTSKLVKLVQQYFGYSSAEAADALPLLDNDTLLDYTEQLGYQPEEVKVIKRELKKRV